jgi:hypothetical protein
MSRYGAKAKRRDTFMWVAGIALIIVTALIVIWVGYTQVTRDPPLDKTTMCPASGPLGHIVLLVDKTDPLNFTQRQAFSVTMEELVATKVPEGHLLSIFVLGEKFEQSALPLIELCNPGSDVGKSELNANLKRLRQQYEERFVGPLEDATKSLVAEAPAKASPIFEMLQLVGINGFRKHAVKGPKRLVLVSDMLHNTPQFSMYSGPVEFDPFESTDYAKRTQAELRDVSVELYYLMTTPRLQTRRNQVFWERYFERAGARLSEVRRVEG